MVKNNGVIIISSFKTPHINRFFLLTGPLITMNFKDNQRECLSFDTVSILSAFAIFLVCKHGNTWQVMLDDEQGDPLIPGRIQALINLCPDQESTYTPPKVNFRFDFHLSSLVATLLTNFSDAMAVTTHFGVLCIFRVVIRYAVRNVSHFTLRDKKSHQNDTSHGKYSTPTKTTNSVVSSFGEL